MKPAGEAALNQLEAVFVELRRIPGLTEKNEASSTGARRPFSISTKTPRAFSRMCGWERIGSGFRSIRRRKAVAACKGHERDANELNDRPPRSDNWLQAGLDRNRKENRMPKRLLVLALLAGFVPLVAGGCDSDDRPGNRASRAAAMRAAREAAASHKVCREAEAAKKRIPKECRIARPRRPC